MGDVLLETNMSITRFIVAESTLLRRVVKSPTT